MGKYTPGPWFVDENNDIWRRDPKELYENGGGVAGDKPLACCFNGWYGGGLIGYPAAANAQLIASAPDLLDAAQTALECLEGGGFGKAYAEDVLRAAIRKTEGES